jgi:hypothetical protein
MSVATADVNGHGEDDREPAEQHAHDCERHERDEPRARPSTVLPPSPVTCRARQRAGAMGPLS